MISRVVEKGMEGGSLGGAIIKWKGPGRCDKRMEGGSLGGASKWKGPGRCDKRMEGGCLVTRRAGGARGGGAS